MHEMANTTDPFDDGGGNKQVIKLLAIFGLLLVGVLGALAWFVLGGTAEVTPTQVDAASSPLAGGLGGGETPATSAATPETTEAVPADPATTEPVATDQESTTTVAGDAEPPPAVEPGETQDAGLVFNALFEISQRELGSDDPVGAIAALNDQIGGFPVAPGAVVRRFGSQAERDERERLTRINNRATVEYFVDLPVADVIALYQAESVDYGLPEYEREEGSDDDGSFTEIKFGDFGSHPDPEIEWAAMTVTVREDSGATLVRMYYTVMRPIEDLQPGGLLAQLENSVAHPDYYWPVGAELSSFTLDPYSARPDASMSGSVNMAAATPLGDETAELDTLIGLAEGTGVWVYDRSIDAGVFLDRTDGNEPYQFVAIGFAGDDETFINFRFS